jgi:hypothetical protein
MFLNLLKTNVEKMSIFRLSMMLMKINGLYHSFHDVDENKGYSYLVRDREKLMIDSGGSCSHCPGVNRQGVPRSDAWNSEGQLFFCF